MLFYTVGSEFLKIFSTGSSEGRQCKKSLGKFVENRPISIY